MKYLSNSSTFTFLAAIFVTIYAQGSLCKACNCEVKPSEKMAVSTTQATVKESSEEAKTKKKQTPQTADKVTAEISIGELIDKITILEIKTENITDKNKLKNIRTELVSLSQTRDSMVPKSKELDNLTAQLLGINKQLWVIEDDIRDKERNRCFDKEFIKLARDVYYTNDKRCTVKRKINMLAGSRLVEEKSYAAY